MTVNAEMTDQARIEGWVLYDADCPFCVRLAQRFARLLASRHFQLLPLQTPWISAKLGLAEARLLSEMRLLLPDGTHCGGADALIEMSRRYWWAWPFGQMARVPGVTELLRWGYRCLARQRHGANGVCGIRNASAGNQHLRFLDFLPLLILPLLALVFRNRLAAWVFMWVMAGALYSGCKWLTFRQATRLGANPRLAMERQRFGEHARVRRGFGYVV
jgi:predicted DCC family thiol-disulfide oxidoreductase YuxK